MELRRYQPDFPADEALAAIPAGQAGAYALKLAGLRPASSWSSTPRQAAREAGARSWLWITGGPIEAHANAIKAAGGRWSRKRRAWWIADCEAVPVQLAVLGLRGEVKRIGVKQ